MIRAHIKKLSLLILPVVVLVFLSDSRPAAGNDSVPGAFNLPEVKSINLANGVRAFYIHDDVPQVVIAASFGFGRLYESGDNAGMADCIARMINLAGSEKYPGKKLHEKIDAMGGNFSVQASWENTVIVLQVLRRFEREAFDIVGDIINRPNFDERHWKMAKNLVADDIIRRYDDPATIAFEKTREIIFQGKGYGSVPTAGKVQSYSMEDMKNAWARYFIGSNLIMGISSPSDLQSVSGNVTLAFSSLKKGVAIEYPSQNEEALQSVKANSTTVFLYPKDLPQATVVVGTAAPDINHPGHHSMIVMNYILGAGSFNSHLMREIRVKRGLAYAVASIYKARFRSGVFLAYAQTRNDEAGTVLSLLLENINKMASEPVSDEELTWAKNSINNSYIFNFDTTLNLLNNYIEMAYNRLPVDYFSTYPLKVEGVSAADIMKFDRELLQYGLIKVVIGKKELAEKLAQYGKVVVLPVDQQ
ncbi:MAG: hypothetical protein CVV44_14945 [Spirochaetae bacterium HGW-Spirochaetae-1]|jgi:zinc protease|nr:MAG: hypothetical protein CVV44_14945 [Spirochaetae bacterium HGW-Spirochaetae-1]